MLRRHKKYKREREREGWFCLKERSKKKKGHKENNATAKMNRQKVYPHVSGAQKVKRIHGGSSCCCCCSGARAPGRQKISGPQLFYMYIYIGISGRAHSSAERDRENTEYKRRMVNRPLSLSWRIDPIHTHARIYTPLNA